MRVIVGIPGFTSTGTRTPARHLASPCIMLRKQKVVVVGRVVRPAGSLVDSISIVSTRFLLHVFKGCGFVWPDAFSVVVVDRFYIVVTLPARAP